MAIGNHPRGEQRAERVIWRPVSSLYLDPLNPRITVPTNPSQEQILLTLFEHEALDELALSFARNGYFSEEPLVVVPHEGIPEEFVVVEGNRRLAALKILLDPRLRRRLEATEWPVLSAEREPELRNVPTVLYPTREEVVPYLGFRHITGIKTWDPFAKARYISNLVNSGRPIQEVEEAIGDSTRTVRRLYQALVVYQQIVSDLGMDGEAIRQSFSLLEVLLSQQPIKRLLGIPRALPRERTEEIVPDDRLEALREAVSWVFGDPERGQAPILSDSRMISKFLAPVVGDGQALEHLRRTRDLEEAYQFSGGEREYLLKQLQAARRAAQRALGVLPLHSDDAEVKAEIDRLQTIVEALMRERRP
ncbi:MAG: ParB N-terminal domain-containing protein [Candidatus Rokuibacteriota bacterium]